MIVTFLAGDRIGANPLLWAAKSSERFVRTVCASSEACASQQIRVVGAKTANKEVGRSAESLEVQCFLGALREAARLDEVFFVSSVVFNFRSFSYIMGMNVFAGFSSDFAPYFPL